MDSDTFKHGDTITITLYDPDDGTIADMTEVTLIELLEAGVVYQDDYSIIVTPWHRVWSMHKRRAD